MELQLTQNNFFKLISFVCRRANFYYASPIQWNDAKNVLEMKNEKTLKWLRIRFIYSCIYCAIGVYSVIMNWNRSGTFVKAYVVFSLSGYGWAIPSAYMLYYHGNEVAKLLNCMAQFERSELAKLPKSEVILLKSAKIKKEYLMKLICQLLSMANHFCFVFHSNAFLHPCFPINIGYNFSEYCQNDLGLNGGEITWHNPREIVIRSLIVVTGLFMWVTIVSNGCGMSCLLVIKGHCISSYIKYYTRMSKMEKVTNHRTQRNCLLFRQLQVMLQEFRNLYSINVLLPASIGIVMLQIGITYLWVDLLRKGQAAEFVTIVGLGMFVTVEMIVFTFFLFGNLGKVFEASRVSKEEFRANKWAMGKKQNRKFARSCPLLKIHLGEQNFVEPNTCLVFEEFVVDNLIGILVI